MNKMIKGTFFLSLFLIGGCASVYDSSVSVNETIESHITFGETTKIEGDGLSLSDNTVTISMPGTYIVSGSSEDGKIIVNSSSSGTVRLIMDNVTLAGTEGPVIRVDEAKETVMEASENTESSITVTGEDETGQTAAIMSHDNLVLRGNGTLNLTCEEDGIHVNDSFYVENLNLNITAGDDGIQVNDEILISSATLNIVSGGGALETTDERQDTDMVPSNENGFGHGNMENDGVVKTNISEQENEENKAKGISCEGNIIMKNAKITVNAADDAIHSDADVTSENGALTLQSGDDGIHADGTLTVNETDITVSQSYEGLEAKTMILNSGTIDITSSDDGINTADPDYTGNEQDADSSQLTINGGIINVHSEGDGLDMNGNGEMNGGTVTVYGPSGNGDGAIDYTGTFNVNGGTLLAGGSSGMAVMPSDSSGVNSLMIDASGTVEIQDESGETVLTYTSEKNYANLVIASEKLETGKIYTILQDGNPVTNVTIQSTVTDLSTKRNMELEQRQNMAV